ncbi:ArsR family transcriptional regulator [Algiphilus sp.]|uniref:VpaChn25_0724 family phage protein n=1 Tax=Algiphilus sp. TaxID=1872431 RepID=UPI0025BB6864|nr:ArsR family transcriptional regulator [Algiphilus sp.]MCK5772006.1 ArsR family transcriptional regulator [Algiphilus sp.]
MSYSAFIVEHARLCVLRTLTESAGYQSNSSILRDQLQAYALKLSRDQLDSVLAWLEEQGLVKLEPMGSVKVVVITSRGHDVAEGTAIVPGVRRPSPGE